MLNRRFRGRRDPAPDLLRAVRHRRGHHGAIVWQPAPPARRPGRHGPDQRSASGASSSPGWPTGHRPDRPVRHHLVEVLRLPHDPAAGRPPGHPARARGGRRRSTARRAGRRSATSRCRCSARPSACRSSCRSSARSSCSTSSGSRPAAGRSNASNTMAVYMFDRGFVRFQFGYGSAVAVILFLICARRRARLPALRAAARHRRRLPPDG